jgi:hypothetical protein
MVGIAGVLAVGALVWEAERDRLRVFVIEEPPARVPPPPVRAELQTIPARIDVTAPEVVFAEVDDPIASPRPQLPRPPPARTNPRPRDELAAALLERRQQMAQRGIAGANVDAVAAISFDPSRRSARVVYHVHDSAAEVVEYWALRDGRWQPLDD